MKAAEGARHTPWVTANLGRNSQSSINRWHDHAEGTRGGGKDVQGTTLNAPPQKHRKEGKTTVLDSGRGNRNHDITIAQPRPIKPGLDVIPESPTRRHLTIPVTDRQRDTLGGLGGVVQQNTDSSRRGRLNEMTPTVIDAMSWYPRGVSRNSSGCPKASEEGGPNRTIDNAVQAASVFVILIVVPDLNPAPVKDPELLMPGMVVMQVPQVLKSNTRGSAVIMV